MIRFYFIFAFIVAYSNSASSQIYLERCLNLQPQNNLQIPVSANNISNPLIFVTQQPLAADFGVSTSTFGNHAPTTAEAGRGGDLWIMYPPDYSPEIPSGCLRNLTAEAGQGINNNPNQFGPDTISIRSPSLNWDATCVLFSMVKGSPSGLFDSSNNNGKWQLYEICGLGLADNPTFMKIPQQNSSYNYVEGIYGVESNQIIVTTDIPPSGMNATHLLPLRDEYDRAVTTSGVWMLDRISGEHKIIFNSPSGVFDPMIDSFGRLLFSSWDHLEQDLFLEQGFAFDWDSESVNATILNQTSEFFPEPRGGELDQFMTPYGLMSEYNMKLFFTWQVDAFTFNNAETINHIGRHELSRYLWANFQNDSALTPLSHLPEMSAHMLRTKQNPTNLNEYYFIDAPHFGSQGSGRIFKMLAEPGRNADNMPLQQVSDYSGQFVIPDAQNNCDHPQNGYKGKFRHVVPLNNGQIIVSHSQSGVYFSGGQCTDYTTNQATANDSPNLVPNFNFQIKTLISDGQFMKAGDPVTPIISKEINHWGNGDGVLNSNLQHVPISFSGAMWQLYPIEVKPMSPPTAQADALELPETQVFQTAMVDVIEFKNFLQNSNLALIVSRNVTTRDENDKQQPYNLSVPGGVSSVVNQNDTVYQVPFFRYFREIW